MLWIFIQSFITLMTQHLLGNELCQDIESRDVVPTHQLNVIDGMSQNHDTACTTF